MRKTLKGKLKLLDNGDYEIQFGKYSGNILSDVVIITAFSGEEDI